MLPFITAEENTAEDKGDLKGQPSRIKQEFRHQLIADVFLEKMGFEPQKIEYCIP
jgi:hypothetical protein